MTDQHAYAIIPCMSEKSKTHQSHSQSHSTPMPSRQFRRRMSAAVAGTGMLVGAIGGATVMNRVDGIREHNSNTACAVPAHDGDMLDTLEAKLGSSDDVQIYVTTGPDAPFKRNEKNTRNYYNPNNSFGLQAGDEVVVNHVDPNVCINVGGVVLAEVSPQAVVEAASQQAHS